MALVLFGVNNGYFDDVDVKKALACEKAMIGYIKANCADLLARMESTKDLDSESEKQLAAGIVAFKTSWA